MLSDAFYPAKLITPRVAFGIEQLAIDYRNRARAVQETEKPR
jgi:hypothetical protein